MSDRLSGANFPPATAQQATPRPMRGYNPLLTLPIATQLTLGFVVAALVAALGAGTSGFQRAQSLGTQATFYQTLSDTNTNLTTGTYYLEITQIGLQNLIADAGGAIVSQETVNSDADSLKNDITLADAVAQRSIQPSLPTLFPTVKSLLTPDGLAALTKDHDRLSVSAQRAWITYRNAVIEIQSLATSVTPADRATAQALVRSQAEPLNAEATSAIRALIRSNNQAAALVRQNGDAQARGQAIITIAAAVLGFLVILGIGVWISNGIVRRLNYLRRVTLAVEDGELDQRVPVVGRDELARVSQSVNGMLDTIVGLLEETRRQRDALMTAADRLFGDMRVAGAGDLRVSATVSNDPIGMLSNAFNLTVGRFRRFILRMQATTEQLDAIAYRQQGRTQQFFGVLQQQIHQPVMPPPIAVPGHPASGEEGQTTNTGAIASQMQLARIQVQSLAQEGTVAHLRILLETAEEVYLSSRRLHQLADGLGQARSEGTVNRLAQLQGQELSTLEAGLQRLGAAAYALQKSSNARLRELAQTIDHLGATVLALPLVPRGSGNSQPFPGRAVEPLPIAGTFAREVGELANELGIIVREMRAGIAPFRTDGPEPGPLSIGPYGNR